MKVEGGLLLRNTARSLGSEGFQDEGARHNARQAVSSSHGSEALLIPPIPPQAICRGLLSYLPLRPC